MSIRRDKQKVIDEVWDDDRIRGFLDRIPADPEVDADFHRLLGAYQSMRGGDFRRFLAMFSAAGGNLDAGNERGETLATVIAGHRHAGDFLAALSAQGATAPAAGPAATPIRAQET